MAQHFLSDMQNTKPSFPSYEIDPNMEIMSQFPELNNPGALDASNLNMQTPMGFSHDSYFSQLLDQFPGNLAENFPAINFPSDFKNVLLLDEPMTSAANDHMEKKRKLVDITPESSSANSSPPISENGIRRKNRTGKGKRIRSNGKNEEEKPKEVVHVRAKRGQATDSHSLAERVRRGKINERLRCLQDIVPGCHKTMGMSVMLDEIINYVQSLQNQVEFLSMKLTAASNFDDFNGETVTMDTLQQKAKAFEAMKMQKLMKGEGCDGLGSTQVGSFDLTFGCYPSLPFNT
ncbi:hypothetical protein ACH5RR_024959 [Cinchona calisaya]|uniref:BHLH domain-containing protein n=1 Tax=Cinchona calisaya TaxID=153742 RepID=A0ABD2Z1G5_9GENT